MEIMMGVEEVIAEGQMGHPFHWPTVERSSGGKPRALNWTGNQRDTIGEWSLLKWSKSQGSQGRHYSLLLDQRRTRRGIRGDGKIPVGGVLTINTHVLAPHAPTNNQVCEIHGCPIPTHRKGRYWDQSC
jgi:hypothetical protein